MTPLPRDSATLVLMREVAGAEPEVLLVRRHERTAVNAGVFVFPGGLLEAQDYAAETLGLCDFDPAEAARLLTTAPSPDMALGYFLAAIRETFEEVGILIARDGCGSPVDPRAFTGARSDMREGRISFWDWMAAQRLRPAVGELSYFAHWITPKAMSRRFDTRFFVARASADHVAEPDHAEVDECRWIAPRAALAAHREGSMRLVNATVKNLELLASCADFTAAQALCQRTITAILPKAVPEGSGYRIVNPWEAEYETL